LAEASPGDILFDAERDWQSNGFAASTALIFGLRVVYAAAGLFEVDARVRHSAFLDS